MSTLPSVAHKSRPPTEDHIKKLKDHTCQQLMVCIVKLKQKQNALYENNDKDLRKKALLNASCLAAKAELRTKQRESWRQKRALGEKLGRKPEKEQPEVPVGKRAKV